MDDILFVYHHGHGELSASNRIPLLSPKSCDVLVRIVMARVSHVCSGVDIGQHDIHPGSPYVAPAKGGGSSPWKYCVPCAIRNGMRVEMSL